MSRRPIIVGNWKMHKTIAESVQFIDALAGAMNQDSAVEGGIGAPFTALAPIAERIRHHGKPILLAAQNCHTQDSGAYTGEIAIPMLIEAGCSHIIVGHSERRQYFNEEDAFINEKTRAILAHDRTPILCIGERLEEREAGQTFDVVGKQLSGGFDGISPTDACRIVLAYEPVWAIGTGKTATPEQAQEVHAFLRGRLAEIYNGDTAGQIRIQYGGSVKPANVSSLMALPDVDGALVGGASLEADSFIQLLNYQDK